LVKPNRFDRREVAEVAALKRRRVAKDDGDLNNDGKERYMSMVGQGVLSRPLSGPWPARSRFLMASPPGCSSSILQLELPAVWTADRRKGDDYAAAVIVLPKDVAPVNGPSPRAMATSTL
jgi:hypothetical protein